MALDALVDSTQLDSDLTSVANAIRTKGGTSASLAFPAGFVSAIDAIPTGGGGGSEITIASGTFVGDNNAHANGRMYIPIGKKMPQTDFYILISAKNGEEYTYDSNYKWVWLFVRCEKKFGQFDLSSTGAKNFIESTGYTIDSNNSGTITQVKPGKLEKLGVAYRNAGLTEVNYNTFQIGRNAFQISDFCIFIGHSNAAYPFPVVTFEWKIVYFGNDSANDIVDLS